MRLLITCSRSFTEWDKAREILQIFATYPEPKILVHGACPQGDAQIAEIAEELGWTSEPHPAKWKRPDGTKDPQAGFKRNAEMVSLGADSFVAFIGPCTSNRCASKPPHDSHGATHTTTLARKAGILVWEVR